MYVCMCMCICVIGSTEDILVSVRLSETFVWTAVCVFLFAFRCINI
jgi:hypothetical protein